MLILASWLVVCVQNGGDNPGKPSPEVGQDVVAAGAECGKESVAVGAFQRAFRQAAVGFHVADFRLDGTSATEIRDQLWRQTAPCAADQHAGSCFAVAAVSAVGDGERGALIGQDRHLFQRFLQCVAVVRVARKAAHVEHEALDQRRSDGHFAAELITDPRLAFRDAIDPGFVQGVNLVAALGFRPS